MFHRRGPSLGLLNVALFGILFWWEGSDVGLHDRELFPPGEERTVTQTLRLEVAGLPQWQVEPGLHLEILERLGHRERRVRVVEHPERSGTVDIGVLEECTK